LGPGRYQRDRASPVQSLGPASQRVRVDTERGSHLYRLGGLDPYQLHRGQTPAYLVIDIPGQGQLAMEENPSTGLVFHQGCSSADQDRVGVRDQGQGQLGRHHVDYVRPLDPP